MTRYKIINIVYRKLSLIIIVYKKSMNLANW